MESVKGGDFWCSPRDWTLREESRAQGHSAVDLTRRGTVPLTGGRDGDPPPFDLAQLCVWHLNLERQSRDPHVELQVSAQVAVGEVHHHLHLALHLFAIHENVVTPVRHLRGGD